MASMATKTNGFSGEACQEKDSNRCSLNDADLSSPRVNSACNDRHHTSSEASHPRSACLSRESLSENAESEGTFRDCNNSEEIKMIIKPNLRQTCTSNCGSMKAPIFHDKVVSKQLEKQESECLGDNISFICGSDYSKTRASGHGDTVKEHASYSLASVDSFSKTEKALNDQPASCCLGGSPCDEVDDNHPKRSNRSCNESSQEVFCSKSDFSEISSLRDSCAGASSAKGERSECSEEQVQSSFAREDAVQVGSQIADEHNFAESIQVDTGINGREQSAELKSANVVKGVNMEETTVGSQPAAYSDGSGSTEYEVRVCDICGDIGREELLAVCSRCNDGAEHIYCMRIKMDNIPKGDWMCEECMLSEETKQKLYKLEEGVRILEKSNTLESKTKGLNIEGSKAYKPSSTPFFSSKRPAGNLQTVRTRPFKTVLKSPCSSSSSSKIAMHHSGGHSSSNSMETVRIPTESSSKSPKWSLQSQVSRGFLFKSKSFSVMSLKEDVQQLNDASFRNEGFTKETAAYESKGRVQMLSKSMSLKNLRSLGVNNGNHGIKLPPSFSRGEDLKRLRHAKGHHSTKTENKLRLAKADSFASIAGKRIASAGKNSLPHSSSSSCHDLLTVKGYEISDNSVKISGHSALGGSANEEKKRAVDVSQYVECSTELVPPISAKHSNANGHSGEQPCLRDSSMFASEVHMPSWISAVPQLNYMWQGKFEIQRSGELPFTCDGMQAHLSTYASHKVLEVVQKLPQKLLLEEAPRLSTWPSQFMKSHATEDNIALYFFAEDLDSYERSYKKLLDRMIKNDFSLKGNFGGIELLIFSSCLLPGKSQCWNNMLFLWGIFRGKRTHCSREIPAVSTSENSLPPEKLSQSIHASLVSCNTQQTLNTKAVNPGIMNEVCEIKASSLEHKSPYLQSCIQQVGKVDSYQRGERESKKRPEIDLNYPPQESQEYSANCTDTDERDDCKRLKSCFSGTNMGNNSINDINNRCSIAINGTVPSISAEVKCDRAYQTSLASPELDSVGNEYSWKASQQQILSSDRDNQLDSSVSSLAHSPGVERSLADERNKLPFFMLMGGKDLQDPNSERETSGDTNPSLALSLALPQPKCPDVNTTLSLF
ncbi:hypothetical protein DITRI_Ditri07aG0168900 [Diplodiscus trichospermus]